MTGREYVELRKQMSMDFVEKVGQRVIKKVERKMRRKLRRGNDLCVTVGHHRDYVSYPDIVISDRIKLEEMLEYLTEHYHNMKGIEVRKMMFGFSIFIGIK